jgi:hypothetical protein
MKQECKNCSNWSKVSGTKKNKSEQGLCKFMGTRVHTIWETEEPIRDKNNKSLVIKHRSQICGDINGLNISSTSKNFIHRRTCIWTDAGFSCAGYIPF